MKNVFSTMMLTSALLTSGLASASCSISDVYNFQFLETVHKPSCNLVLYGPYCLSKVKRSKQFSFSESQKLALEEKGYAIVSNNLAQFVLSKDSATNVKKDSFSLYSTAAKRAIWSVRYKAGGKPESSRRHAQNKKIDVTIQKLSAQMARSNDPREITENDSKIKRLKALIDPSLDEKTPGKSTIDSAIKALPVCN